MAKEKKKNKKIEKKNLDHLADSMSEVTINDEVVRNETIMAAAPVLKVSSPFDLFLLRCSYLIWSKRFS